MAVSSGPSLAILSGLTLTPRTSFYLVLIVPSAVYIVLIYLLFPETKGRTLEEIGTLFGDDAHVAAHWYNITEEEKEKIAQNALQLTKSGRIPDEPELKPPVNDIESNDGSQGEKEKVDERLVEDAEHRVVELRGERWFSRVQDRANVGYGSLDRLQKDFKDPVIHIR